VYLRMPTGFSDIFGCGWFVVVFPKLLSAIRDIVRSFAFRKRAISGDFSSSREEAHFRIFLVGRRLIFF
jgi:hypothetical protein